MRKIIAVLLLALLFTLPAAGADLCLHIADDPDARGFSAMTSEEVAADLNGNGPDGNYKTVAVESISGRMFLSQVDVAELRAKSDMNQLMVLTLAGNADIDPFGPAAGIVVAIFGSGSVTVNALADIRNESVSPVAFYGLSRVKIGHVEACLQ